MTIKKVVQVATIAMTFACAAAQAAPVMPSFAGAPAGWTTDRYDPAAFSDIGAYQGHTDVLRIGISNTDSLANRPAAFQSSFYNTQGKQQAITGAGAGSVLAADLYLSSAWANASAGNVRTDMWGVMRNPVNSDLDYTIIGFTNYGGAARLRVWDGDIAGGWFDVMAVTNFDRWVSLAIDFTGSSYVYSIDGATVYTDSTINGSNQFSAAIMQAYNFGDPSLGATAADYSVNWSNTQANAVPEPGEFALLGIGLLGMVAARRRAKKSA